MGASCDSGAKSASLIARSKDRQEFSPPHAAAIEAQRSAIVDGLLPAAERLKFGTRKRARAGPTGDLKQLRRQLSPGQRRLRAARKLLQTLLVLSSCAQSTRQAASRLAFGGEIHRASSACAAIRIGAALA